MMFGRLCWALALTRVADAAAVFKNPRRDGVRVVWVGVTGQLYHSEGGARPAGDVGYKRQ